MAEILSNEEFENNIKNNIVLCYFGAPWCGPCRMLSPLIDEIREERKDILIIKLNVDESAEIAGKYAIRSIPTLITFKDGKEVDRMVGSNGKADINDMLDSLK